MAARKKASNAPSGTKPSTRNQQADRSKSATTAAKSSARSTMSGPARKGSAADITDAATAKIAGTETLAASMPHNASKPGEFGDAAMQPPTGQSVEPPHPMV